MKLPPTVVKGRKGQRSIADVIIETLWPIEEFACVPSKSLEELRVRCSEVLKFEVASSTLRSTLYRHPEFFQKAEKSTGPVQYLLCHKFVNQYRE